MFDDCLIERASLGSILLHFAIELVPYRKAMCNDINVREMSVKCANLRTQMGLIKQHSTRRWAHYSLNVPGEIETVPMQLTEEDRILAYVREHGSINRSKCEEILSVSEARVKYLLKKLIEKKRLKMEGKKKGAKYVLP